MKCNSCGNNLHIEDAVCPHCGVPNPHYVQHRKDMARYKEDYRKVRGHVVGKSGFFAKWTVKITIVAVLLVVELTLIIMKNNAWNLAYNSSERQAKKNYEEYAELLDSYEATGNYSAFYVFYELKKLLFCEKYDSYDAVAEACRLHGTIRYDFAYIIQCESKENKISALEGLSRRISEFYSAIEPKENDKRGEYSEVHMRTMEQLKRDVEMILVTYGGISPEDAQNFSEMSEGNRRVALEEGLGLNEE